MNVKTNMLHERAVCCDSPYLTPPTYNFVFWSSLHSANYLELNLYKYLGTQK